MSKLVLILVFHKPNFFLKAAILSWLLKMFESRSCSDKFSPLIRLNISARYASLQSQVSSMMRDASLALYSVRNNNSSSRSSKRRLITLPRESHRTSVWNKRLECSAPSSSHYYYFSESSRGPRGNPSRTPFGPRTPVWKPLALLTIVRVCKLCLLAYLCNVVVCRCVYIGWSDVTESMVVTKLSPFCGHKMT